MDLLDRCVIIAAAGLIGWQLFIPPVTGLANNGDFHKVLGAFSLASLVDDEYRFASQKFTFSPAHYVAFGFYSTEQVLAVMAIGINRLFSNDGRFDIRFIGFVHGALYVLALWLVLPLLRYGSFWRRLTCVALIVFLFCDAFYVIQLNSFYMDTAAIVFFFLTAVLLARWLAWGRRADLTGFLICAALMIASKAQHAPIGFVFAALLAMGPAAGLPRIPIAARAYLSIALVALSLLSLKATPWFYTADPIFSTVFYSILPHSKDPAAELRSLGLDESMVKYIGKFAYSEGSPTSDRDWDRDFLSKVSYGKLGWYLAQHPALTYNLLIEGLGVAGRQRPAMGNFDRSTGRPEFSETQAFATWSTLKRKMFEQHGGRYLTYVTLLGMALGAWWIRARAPAARAACALAAIMLGEMFVSILADPLDQVRHSLVFAALTDVALFVCLIALILTPASNPKKS
jgi:hypothetical protein